MMERRLDAIDLLFGMPQRTAGENPAELRGAAKLAGQPAATAFQYEIAAILAVVPQAYRSNAQWAVPLLLTTARSGGISHLRRLSYVLATAQHGARFGAQLEEHGTDDGEARFFEPYEPNTPLGAALGNTERGDGERFRGRGFVHIRGRASYAVWSRRLGLPDQLVEGTPVPFFVAHPAALAQPNVAAQTLVRGMRDGLFTGTTLGHFINDKQTDYYSARRVVNGTGQAGEIAESAMAFARAIEAVHSEHHRERMQRSTVTHDCALEIRAAVERLAARGTVMPLPLEVVEWNGEARQGKFVQLDEKTVALHTGRGTYVRLNVQRDLNGVVPPEGSNMALKRSGEVRPAARYGEGNFWR
jgi:putative chitinase